MAWVWCTDLPHRVHLLTFLSFLDHVFPLRSSLPCYASFVPGREYGCAIRFLFAMHARVA